MNIRPVQLTVSSAESFSLEEACQPAMQAIIEAFQSMSHAGIDALDLGALPGG
jgi:hypothetical protein